MTSDSKRSTQAIESICERDPDLEQFRKELQLGQYTQSTVRNYLEKIDNLKRNYSITQEGINDYLSTRHNCVFTSAIKAYFRFKKIKDIEIPRKRGRIPPPQNKEASLEDIQYMIKNLPLEQSVAVHLMAVTGLRVNSALSLKFSDINFTTLSIKILGKNRVINEIVMTPAVASRIKKIFELRKRKIDADIFSFTRHDLYPVFKRCSQELGRKISPHSLRHSFAMNLRRRGFSLEEIQSLLHHKSPATTQRYSQVDRQKLLKKLQISRGAAKKDDDESNEIVDVDDTENLRYI